jgi:hypothetical protein
MFKSRVRTSSVLTSCIVGKHSRKRLLDIASSDHMRFASRMVFVALQIVHTVLPARSWRYKAVAQRWSFGEADGVRRAFDFSSSIAERIQLAEDLWESRLEDLERNPDAASRVA